MSVKELVDKVRHLSQDELRELARRVPGLREAIEVEKRERLAEAQVAYQVEGTVGIEESTGAREVLTPEERWGMSREELAARYKHPVQWTEHPWVVRVEGYRGGRPIILGTSIPIRTIAIAWVKQGMPIWDVLDNWSLHEAQVYDALSYYYDHKEELDEDIRLHYDTEFWMRKYPPGKAKTA